MEKDTKIIMLPNRYRVKNYLEEVEENKYAFRFEDEKEAGYFRVGLAEGKKWEDNEFSFIDPSGGPFLSVGGLVTEDLAITRIYSQDNTYYIETEKEEND